jgi:hypothetical protein
MKVATPAPKSPPWAPIVLVAELAHQPVPQPGDVAVVHTRPSGPLGEAVARQRRDDDVEGGTVDAVGLRVGQQRHQRQQLHEGAGPAVAQDQRQPVPIPRPLVDEVDAHAVQVGLEVVEGVEVAFLSAPVELVGPVGEHLPEVGEVGALLPGLAWCGVGPAGVADTRPQVG